MPSVSADPIVELEDVELTSALELEFYERESHELARALLGQVLVRAIDDELLAGTIVEVEVYGGTEDPASHSNSGKPTSRTEAMFGPAGTAYVYTIYGIYQCLNVVAPKVTHASAILIRALEPLKGHGSMAASRGFDEDVDDRKLLSGPGKLCQAMAIDKSLDGQWLTDTSLYIVAGADLGESQVDTSTRIGLNPKTCGESVDWEWRYTVLGSRYLSRKA